MSRRVKWVLAGILGLLANAGVMGLLYAWQEARGGRPIIVLPPALGGQSWALDGLAQFVAYIFLLGLALAEIPLMVAGLRTLARSRTRSDWILYSGNLAFVFFAAVYATILIVVTNRLDLSLTIAGVGLLRLGAGIIWVRPGDAS
jgi:hypothetical protein